ncbi:MAG: hypothetical protein QOE19_2206 [Actinomycetota bacterium]|jgi:hypothetical protein|nr:hypothetical protein [Actinomycetota bacterium]MDQ1667254.1 hypothetical protein [Actinomycetota bacterium]MDQ1670551.1 hypothetical protein [Actinomycetota bacterium]
MRRRTFDVLFTAGGLALAVLLLLAGGLLTWAHGFVTDQVTTQLTQQQIFFPPKGEATADPAIGPFINKYAGQQLVTGEQARAFADHYIAVHLKESGGGLTYSELSNKSRANPNDTELAGQVQSAFRGETLRGLLLNAYAFGKMGQIALIAAIASFIGAGVLLLLSLLGFVHLRRVDPDEEILTVSPRRPTPVTV